MVLLSTPKSGGLAGAPPTAVPHLVAAGGILGVLFMFRTWTLHILDVLLAWARGLPALREKNVYLKGAMTVPAAPFHSLPAAIAICADKVMGTHGCRSVCAHQ
jgi:hypothetical protein